MGLFRYSVRVFCTVLYRNKRVWLQRDREAVHEHWSFPVIRLATYANNRRARKQTWIPIVPG